MGENVRNVHPQARACSVGSCAAIDCDALLPFISTLFHCCALCLQRFSPSLLVVLHLPDVTHRNFTSSSLSQSHLFLPSSMRWMAIE